MQIEPALWAPGLGGDLRMPGGGSTINVERLEMDTPELAPYGELHIRAERWMFSISGFGFQFKENVTADRDFTLGGLAFGDGDDVRARVDFVSAQATVGYRLGQQLLAGESLENGVALLIDVVGGVRAYDMDVDIRLIGEAGGLESDEFWVEPIVGGRLAFEVLEDFTVDLLVTGGVMPFGDQTSASLDVVVGFSWRFLDTAGLQLGYRFLYTNLESGSGDDSFQFDGSLAGLFGSLVFRW